jgi:hypothetical protein
MDPVKGGGVGIGSWPGLLRVQVQAEQEEKQG